MSIAEELQEIEELYAHGTLTPEEFEQAKAKVLAAETVPSSAQGDSQTARQIAGLQQRNAVAELDRDWETGRQQYMLKGKYGSYSVPTESGSISSGILCVGLGLGAVVMGCYWLTSSRTSSHASGTLLLLAGVIFAVYSVIASINSYAKAGQYREAEQGYQEKRARLLSGPVQL